jgi:hypothetical protein
MIIYLKLLASFEIKLLASYTFKVENYKNTTPPSK